MWHRILTVVGAAFLIWSAGQAENQPAQRGVELKVLEVRALTELEAVQKSPGFEGPNVLLRLRLENKSNQPVFVLLLEGSLDPLVCMGREDLTSQKCWPKMLGLPHEWLLLPPSGAIEWEEMDASAFAGQKHVLRVMIRRGEGATDEEVASGPYMVPAKIEEPSDRQHL